jgi:hypothetical protein
MAHYAFLDENNIVTEVITGKDEDDLDPGVTDWEEWYGNFRGQRCLRTSYNTRGNMHTSGGVPFRYNFAQVGGRYDDDKDGFIPPKPINLSSWILDNDNLRWMAPVPYPTDGEEYVWLESELRWLSRDEYLIHFMSSSGE